MGGSAVITKNMSKKPPSRDESSADSASADKEEVIAGSATTDNEEVIADSATTDNEDVTELLASDPDPVQLGEAAAVAAGRGKAETRAEAESLSGSTAAIDADQILADAVSKPAAVGASSPKARFPWFGLINFLLILALAGAVGYYWREQQKLAADYQANNQADLANMQQQLQRVEQTSSKRLQSSLSPLETRIGSVNKKIGSLDSKVDELGLGQQDLRESGEKLYELFGRDKNAWQLAEVEYLMRVAQHKLILQDDFEGAAITLQAASDRIGLTGDPGLLPVRVMISEEIADLKTRRRADLVGMTLILAQLGRQVRGLQPGFAVRVEQSSEESVVEPSAELGADPQTMQDWFDRFSVSLDSLISISKESTEPTEIEANIVDVSEVLEDNLKLARWAVLERDANQYQLLIDRSLRLFGEFYDLDNAANHDFMTQLQELQKMVIKPEKPDITGSLRELQRILSQRAVAPQPEAPQPEAPQPEAPQPAATQPAATQPAATQPAAPPPADVPAAESDNG
jgi:uroporphyrin-3 C-methyltransferase